MIYLIGAGGHCKVVLDALLAGGVAAEAIRIRDADPARQGGRLLGVGIEGPEIDGRMAGAGVHVAIGSAAARARLYGAIRDLGGEALSIRHPAAQVSAFAQIAGGVFLAAASVVAADASVGLGSIVNHGAIVDHDCAVGEVCHIAPNATLGGGVVLGDSVLVGAGAALLPGVRVGAGATIGAGAVVTRDVGPGEVWTGVPAVRREPGPHG